MRPGATPGKAARARRAALAAVASVGMMVMVAVAGLCVGVPGARAQTQIQQIHQTLPPEVEAALARERLPRDALAVMVTEVDARATPRLAWRATQAVNPASIMKLLTTYAALDTLGPAFTWTTPVLADGPVEGGTLKGNLYIRGQGDPKLVVERLWLATRRLQAQGVRHIAGDIVLDHGAFDLAEQAPGDFDGEPLRPYNAQPDALLLNFKSVVLSFSTDGTRQWATVGAEPALAGVQWPATVPVVAGPCSDWRAALRLDLADPARPRFNGALPAGCGAERQWPLAWVEPRRYAQRMVEALWRDAGGRLDGQVREGPTPASARVVLDLQSPALSEMVRDVNKFSNNVMAQQMFLTLSLRARGVGTAEGSRELLRAWWRDRLGPDDMPVMDNGSGLSRHARASAQALARLLQSAWASPVMPELMASLPVSGLDGTLRRSRGAAGVAHLKTGSLRDVAGVAGYVLGASGRRYVLVAIVNHPQAGAARPAIDALIDWTARDR